jgi:hypothetical protein
LALGILGSMVGIMSQQGEVEAAVELAAFVHHHPASEQQTRAHLEAVRAELASRLPADVAAAAEARGMALDLESVLTRTSETQ